MIGHPDADWIGAHRVLDFEQDLEPSFETMPMQAALPLRFTLAQHLLRGGHRASLHAASNARSLEARERWLRTNLPDLPLDQHDRAIDPALFWPLAAELNGYQFGKLQQRLRLDNGTMARTLAVVAQRGLIYPLEH